MEETEGDVMGSPSPSPSSDYLPFPGPLCPQAQVLVMPPELLSWTSVIAATLISCLNSFFTLHTTTRVTLSNNWYDAKNLDEESLGSCSHALVYKIGVEGS